MNVCITYIYVHMYVYTYISNKLVFNIQFQNKSILGPPLKNCNESLPTFSVNRMQVRSKYQMGSSVDLLCFYNYC